jgi:hypothetical protein
MKFSSAPITTTALLALAAGAFGLHRIHVTQADDEVWTQEELEAVTAEIQAEVAELRGQPFKRSVAVKITDKEGFIGYATKRMNEMAGPERLAAEETIAKMLGLVPPSMDLMAVTMSLLEDQVGGFYDPASNAFYLMETFTGGVAKVILAHELTHALDDQLYDIDGTLAKYFDDRDRSAAYMAVVEGSGTAVMSQWTMSHISEIDPRDLAKAATMGSDSLESAPAVVWKPLLAAYTQGQSFLQKGYRRLKRTEELSMAQVTQRAFQDPPRSTEQILHPEKYWDPEKLDEPKALPEPAPTPEGWDLLDSSALGELHLALMTEEPKEIDFSNQMALAFLSYTNKAASGWGADRVDLYGRGSARVLKLTTTWDTPEDAAEFVGALEERLLAWRAALAELDPEELGSGVAIEYAGEESSAVVVRCWHGGGLGPFGG